MSTELPTDILCFDCNLSLWLNFENVFYYQRGYLPSRHMWTEAEVTQWLDLEYQEVSSVDRCLLDVMLK